MTTLVEQIADRFLQASMATLPAFAGMWAAGLVMYLVTGSLILRRRRRGGEPSSSSSASASLFPRLLWSDPTARITAWHFALQVVFWAPLFAMFTFAPSLAAETVAGEMIERFGSVPARLHLDWLVVPVQSAVIVLSMSLGSYLHHLSFHKVPVLWSFHRSHHSVEALTLPSTARHHPLDLFTIQIVMNLFAAVFGGLTLYATGTHLHPATFIVVGAGALAYFAFSGIFNHSHIPISWGWFNRIGMAPIMHQFHHSAESRHRDKNIGSFWGLMIWDWMFGTLYLPDKDEAYRWGLNETELGANNPHQRLRDFYLEPFADVWRVMTRKDRELAASSQ